MRPRCVRRMWLERSAQPRCAPSTVPGPSLLSSAVRTPGTRFSSATVWGHSAQHASTYFVCDGSSAGNVYLVVGFVVNR